MVYIIFLLFYIDQYDLKSPVRHNLTWLCINQNHGSSRTLPQPSDGKTTLNTLSFLYYTSVELQWIDLSRQKRMKVISGFRIDEVIFDNDQTSVFRASLKNVAGHVILKTRKDLNNNDALYRLQREFDFLALVESSYTVKALELKQSSIPPLLVLDDVKGAPLSPHTVHKTYPIAEKLALLINITKALDHIHSKKIIHKGINPSNILCTEDHQVRIIDFGSSEYFSANAASVEQESIVEMALEYVSPEQTGRMNNTIDYRTDFYSLGITFYQLLTGILPFESTDPLELIHCHIAKLPLLPSDMDHSIPLILSELVVKLIQKNSRDRYQSAKGILADLVQCLEKLEANGNIEDFELATHDISNQFFIPDALYGREDNVARLHYLFLRSKQGEKQLVTVSGYSGLGKTSLVHNLHSSILLAGGFFGVGKFGEFESDIPCSALLDAFRGIIRHLLTFESDEIQWWKTTLNAALYPNAQLIIDAIPELVHIIGQQAEVGKADPTFAFHRFKHAMLSFIRCLATEEHPLTIYIDDLQWADVATLELLDLIADDSEIKHCLLVSSYRENEIGANQPLIKTLNFFKNTSAKYTKIELSPLTTTDIGRLLSDTLCCPASQLESLSDIVTAKSQGNPYFVYQLLEQLHEENLIYFDEQRQQWCWDTTRIGEYNLDGDIGYILKKKIGKLPYDSLALLKIASCLGPKFTVNTLQLACSQDKVEIHSQLQQAVQEGLLIETRSSASSQSPLTNSSFLIPGHANYYLFSHDRVRQAVYNLHQRRDIPKVHFEIATNLQSAYCTKDIETNIFGLVKHFNLGKELLTTAHSRRNVCDLNLLAAKRSLSSVAYQASWDYVSQALSLLPEDCWEADYALCLLVHQQLVESGFLSGRYKESERFARRILDKATSRSDKPQTISYLMQGYFTQGKKEDAIAIGLEFIKEYGIHFPSSPTKTHITRDIIKTKWALRNFSIDNIANIDESPADAAMIEYGEVINQLGMLCYRIEPQLLPLIILWGVRETIHAGSSKYSPISMTAYGMILASGLQEIEKGYKYGQVALTLAKRETSVSLAFRTDYACNATLRYWKIPIRQYVDDFIDNHKQAVKYGDNEIAQFALYCHSLYRFHAGDSIDICMPRCIEQADVIASYNQPMTILQNAIMVQAIANLAGESTQPHILKGQYYNVERAHLASQDNTTLFKVHYFSMYLSYIFGNFQDAVDHANKAERYIEGEFGMYSTAVVLFYQSLSLLETYGSCSSSEKTKVLRKVKNNQRKYANWASSCPENFVNKHAIVDAKLASIRGKNNGETFAKFEKSIELSEQYGFLQESAIAKELAADFCLSIYHSTTLAKGYILAAHNGYTKWKAKAKIDHFEEKFSTFFTQHSELVGSGSNREQNVSKSIDNPNSGNLPTSVVIPKITKPKKIIVKKPANLDITSVVKASQSISNELVLPKLLDGIMNLIIENAGAQKGILLLEESGILHIEASCNAAKSEEQSIKRQPFESYDRIAKSIVRYSYRTQEVILIGNAQKSHRFSQDPHIRTDGVISVLCCPLINQSKVIGVLYLENNISEASFTKNHVEIIKLLSSQSAISIEKSRIFEQLERRNSQISHLLDITKELNGAKTKVEAAQLALTHLIEITGQDSITEAILYLPQQNSDSSNGYTLLKNTLIQSDPLAFIIDDQEKDRIAPLVDISLLNNKLSIPLTTGGALVGSFVISNWCSDENIPNQHFELIESIGRTLAITINNLNAKENSRLSSIGAMAASIVHDLKNPIGAIIGYADMADCDDLVRESRSDYLSIIRKEATRMSDMAHEVLEFSAGVITLHKATISTDDFLNDVSEVLSSTFKQADMDYSAHNSAPCLIDIDVDRIRRVLLNLATNARDAMANNANTRGLFSLNITQKKQGLCIEVKDNGPGIPEHIRATLFEPFITHGKSNGTGLGMAIVKKTLDAHGGNINFVTNTDGTTFCLFFPEEIFTPLNTPLISSSNPSQNPRKPATDLRILLAEDNVVNQKLIKAMLRKLDLNCTVVHNGNQVLSALQESTYDVILMDIEMPELNGYEATKAIRRSHEHYCSIPIIALTGHSGAEELDRFVNSGMNHCVLKPISLSDLSDSLVNIVSEHTPSTEVP